MPVPPASATVRVPVLTVFSPVVSPSEAFAFCVTPSIFRSKSPGSPAGERLFITSSLPVFLTLETVQRTYCSSPTATLSGPAPSLWATIDPAPPLSRHTMLLV